MPGKVTFIGAGSGDPRLLTLRAVEVLEEADFVVFDPEVHPEILGRLRVGTPRHPVSAQLGPDRVADLLVQAAKEGQHAVRLAWGDPLLFGRGDAEGVAVARRNVPLEIVPGIGPFIAVGAFAGIPLTRSTDASPSVAVVSVTNGHEGLHDWQKLATATDTLAIFCDADSVAETARSLVFYGRPADEPVSLVQNVSLPTQDITETTLRAVPLLPRPKAARLVMVVGDRALPVHELEWREKQPLFGKRVLVTRAREQASKTASLLRARGADTVIVPTIEIHPPDDPRPMEAAAATLGRYGWAVFTSANGVERFWEELRRQRKDARAFAGVRIAAIGPGTAAALDACGLAADLVPQQHKGEGLAVELTQAIGASPVRVLLARAQTAREVVPDALRAARCEVDVVPVYQNRAPPRPLLEALASLLEAREIDVVTFTSSSTVEHLCDALESRAAQLLRNTCVASIGPITTETARKRGLRVNVTASEHSMPGLVSAIEGYFELETTGTRRVTPS